MRRTIRGPKITWIDIQDPTPDDVRYVRDNFKFHPIVLDELIPPGYRPKIERYNGYLFMMFYYPIYNKEKRETRSRELDMIVTKDTIVTSHYRSILPLKALFDRCNLYAEAKQEYMSQDTGILLFHILNGFWKTCLVKLVQVDKRLDQIEREIFRGKEREMVTEISYVKTDIINFWRILEPQGPILNSLTAEGASFFGKEMDPYFADIQGTYGQAWNSLKTYKETILALEDTNQSLLSTKTNETIRVLTVFSVIILPLTLLASLWGMNVHVPFSGGTIGFWIIAGAMVVLTIFMFGYFKRRRWL
ncbi:MAG: magnesium transporter CorA family protein [Candidatus Nealsonbacteria bacterium]|nr:magnesium transporter CorA family protein [Candidatus Nealsonbacteria bacterium]